LNATRLNMTSATSGTDSTLSGLNKYVGVSGTRGSSFLATPGYKTDPFQGSGVRFRGPQLGCDYRRNVVKS
jgi:hypothetical protein